MQNGKLKQATKEYLQQNVSEKRVTETRIGVIQAAVNHAQTKKGGIKEGISVFQATKDMKGSQQARIEAVQKLESIGLGEIKYSQEKSNLQFYLKPRVFSKIKKLARKKKQEAKTDKNPSDFNVPEEVKTMEDMYRRIAVMLDMNPDEDFSGSTRKDFYMPSKKGLRKIYRYIENAESDNESHGDAMLKDIASKMEKLEKAVMDNQQRLKDLKHKRFQNKE